MSEKKVEQFKRFCFFAIPVLVVVAIVLTVVGFNSSKNKADEVAVSSDQQSENTSLAKKVPTNIVLNQKLENLTFTNEDSTVINIDDYRGKIVVLSYFASYCPYCKENLENATYLEDYLNKNKDVNYFLIDKLDNQKETKSKACQYISSENIKLPLLFDDDLKVYNQLGIQLIPTTIMIDKTGVVRSITTDKLSEGEFKALISNAKGDKQNTTYDFLKNNMMRDDGEIITNLKEEGKDYVLSESLGLMMLYSIKANDKPLFERTLTFADNNKISNKLASWKITFGSGNNLSNVNATIDDLRIFRALSGANEKFGTYNDEKQNYADNIYKLNVKDDNLVNFYDFSSNQKSSDFNLCYGDFEALGELQAVNPSFKSVKENALKIVESGYISDDFPFYKNSYNYETKSYDENPINMAEEMVTVYNLAKEGKLPSKTHEYLKTALKDGKVYSKYDVDGNIVKGFEYESTAVYGLICLTAIELDDKEMINSSLIKMEQMRIDDTTNKYNGAFGNKDGSSIYSFDQLIPLLVYSELGGDYYFE